MPSQSIPTWKTISAFEDYEISTDGQVRRVQPWKQYPALHELKQQPSWDGYPTVVLYKNRKPRRFKVSRLVALTFLGDPPTNKHEAAHKNGIKADNSLGNIKWATGSENEADKFLHHSRNDAVGERHGSALLTEDLVRDLRRKRALGATYVDLARITGIAKLTIYDATTGVTWRHITDVPPCKSNTGRLKGRSPTLETQER